MADLRVLLKAYEAKARGGGGGGAKAAAAASPASRTGGGGDGRAAGAGGRRIGGAAPVDREEQQGGIDIKSAYRNAMPTHKKRDESFCGKIKQNIGRVTCVVVLVMLIAGGVGAGVALAPKSSSGAVAATGPAPSASPSARPSPTSLTAFADFDNITLAGQRITGRVTFEQLLSGGVVNFTVKLDGFGASLVGPRGFHVHAGSACADGSAHFNPYGSPHGGPANVSASRHVGDLGNLIVGGSGSAMYDSSDALISLLSSAPTRIIGRALTIHAGADDLGLGANTGSTCGPIGTASCASSTNGNAGTPIACAIITAGVPRRR
jgi:Cu-Zn family superoxide dismutase